MLLFLLNGLIQVRVWTAATVVFCVYWKAVHLLPFVCADAIKMSVTIVGAVAVGTTAVITPIERIYWTKPQFDIQRVSRSVSLLQVDEICGHSSRYYEV